MSDGKYPVRTRFGAMVKAARRTGADGMPGVDGGPGTGLAAPSPVLFTYDRWVLTTDGAQTKTLTYLPIDGSVHVYLNGVGLDETVDYDLDAEALTVHSAAGVLTGDVLWARYAYEADSPVSVVESVDGLHDTFDRADTTDQAEVAARSDGGSWLLSSAVEPVADVDRWKIENNKLIKVTDGFYSTDSGNEWLHWAKGDYGDIDEITVAAGIYAPLSTGAGTLEVSIGNAGGNLGGGGINISVKPFEQFTVIEGPSGTLYNTSFTIPAWGGDETIYPLVITYNKITGHLVVTFNGTEFYNDAADIVTGTWIGVLSDRTDNGFAYITVDPS